MVSYSLVWLLIWPTSSREALEDAVRRLVAAHRQLAAHYLTPTIGETHDAGPEALRRQTTQVLARLGGLLDGAEIDSYEVSEARHAWRRLIHRLSQLASTSERVRQSSADVREVDRQRLIPELAEFASEHDRWFAEIGRMLEGRPPERAPVSVPLDIDDKAMASLSPFHRAALLLYRSHLQEIDRLTRDLFETVADIWNFTHATVDPIYDAAPLLPSALDPERFASVVRWFTGLWLAWFIALYVPDIPDTVAFVVLTNSLSMALCVMPQLPIARIFLPNAVRRRSRRRHLRPGDAAPRELRRPGGCDFRGCLPDLLPLPSTDAGRRQGGGARRCSPCRWASSTSRPTTFSMSQTSPWSSVLVFAVWRSRRIFQCPSAPSTCSSACSVASFRRANILRPRCSGIPPARRRGGGVSGACCISAI